MTLGPGPMGPGPTADGRSEGPGPTVGRRSEGPGPTVGRRSEGPPKGSPMPKFGVGWLWRWLPYFGVGWYVLALVQCQKYASTFLALALFYFWRWRSLSAAMQQGLAPLRSVA